MTFKFGCLSSYFLPCVLLSPLHYILLFQLLLPSICNYFYSLGRTIFTYLVPYYVTKLCGSMNCSLVIINLRTNIHYK